MPAGAVIVTDRIARHFDQNVLVCGLTSYAHPLVCEAVAAAIECYRDERLVERAAAAGTGRQCVQGQLSYRVNV
jgi:taurine--2-oxoglutarate transaminase